MNDKVRKSVIYISAIIIIGLVGSLLYFKSDYYLDKKAEKKRQARLTYLDSIKRLYIDEGVYKHKRELSGINFKKDKFGNIISERTTKGYKVYEISFTSKKLVILNTETNIKEEIVFKDKYEIAKVSSDYCYYNFYIDSWQIRSQIPDRLIIDVLPTIKDDDSLRKPFRLCINLSVQSGMTPYFFAYYGFQIPLFDGTYSNSNKDDLFSTPTAILSINLDELVYKYNSGVPDYIRLAKYKDFEYDLKSYGD